jgi:cobaltochelatase CobN
LEASPAAELDGLVTALAGGYVAPSSGADVLRNPAAAPTGRNLYSINAEQMPSEEAWRVGRSDGGQHFGRASGGQGPVPAPRRLFAVGRRVHPHPRFDHRPDPAPDRRPPQTRRARHVYEVEIVPAEELGRPRIDVVVQTSGQFRDAAASRIALIDKAVQMVAELVKNRIRTSSATTRGRPKRN